MTPVMVRYVCYVVLCDMSHYILRVFMLGMLRLPCIISLYSMRASLIPHYMREDTRLYNRRCPIMVIEDVCNGNRRCPKIIT